MPEFRTTAGELPGFKSKVVTGYKRITLTQELTLLLALTLSLV